MEAAAVAGLVGLGYVVSRLAGKNTKEGFNKTYDSGYGMFKNDSQTVAARSPPLSVLDRTPQGGTAVGPNSELDLLYNLPNGQVLPSTPSPTPYGSPLSYGTQQPPLAPKVNFNDISPQPIGSQDSTAQVAMNPSGYETNPSYVNGDFMSQLSGQNIPANDFRHNNMVPFFGGRVKQNVRPEMFNSVLDTYTGSGTTQITKREVEQMFNTGNEPYGNPFGLESTTDFIESRMELTGRRNNEKPMESVMVGPGVGERGGMTGKGGFQQLEVNEIMRPRTTDQIRVATNPKLTYKAQVVPGAHFIGAAADNAGEVRKYRPDTFFIDENNSRVNAGPAAVIKETVRSIQVLPETTRSETTTESFGPAAAQDSHQSYTMGAYRTPITQQYGGAGFRNADMTEYFTNNPDSPEADYGRSSFDNRPNERSTTSKRTMGLNVVPSDSGQVTVRYTDSARPTRRAEMEGGSGSGELGHATVFAGGAPAVTVWDPNDIARTTVKETTIVLDRFGIASSASAPNKLKVYDPNDIAKPTQKALYSNRGYSGSGYAPDRGTIQEDFAYNMRTNPIKEKVSKGRKPIAGAGGIDTFYGEIHQTAKRLVADDVNDRVNAVNRVSGLTPGAGDIGQMKYRVPLELDVQAERFTRDIVAATIDNPLMQSLEKNATIDSMRLAAMRQQGVV
jgi:hypothetical protein